MLRSNVAIYNIPEGMLIEAHEINELPPEKVVILCTGSQGEPMAALARLVDRKLSRCRRFILEIQSF